MTTLNFNIGDKVGIAGRSSYGMRSEGLYTVVKADKVKLVVQRESDKYERTFSVKTGDEKGFSKYHSCILETEAEQLARNAAQEARNNLEKAWDKIAAAASKRSAIDLAVAVTEMKALTA